MESGDESDGYRLAREAASRCLAASASFGVRIPGPEDPAAVAFVDRAVRRQLGEACGADAATLARAIRAAMAARERR